MPAERTIWPPLPGMSSMLWIVVPSGMCEIGQGIADPRLRAHARDHHVADLQAVRQEHVALLAVAVVEQADPGGAVRVVLDRGDPRGHAVLVALEVDPPVVRSSRRRRDGERSSGPGCSGPSRASGGSRSGLYGSVVVISSNVERVIPRRPGEVGL